MNCMNIILLMFLITTLSVSQIKHIECYVDRLKINWEGYGSERTLLKYYPCVSLAWLVDP